MKTEYGVKGSFEPIDDITMDNFTDNLGKVWGRRPGNVVLCSTTEGFREFTVIGDQVMVRELRGTWAPVRWCRFVNRVRMALEYFS